MANVTDATFTELVIERSKTVPVIVDLWAEWCGPCKTLGPILEAAVAATGGRVELAKVDVDANPQVASALRVQSIPAVFVAVDGRIAPGFIGAQPEATVVEFVRQLVPDLDAVSLLVEAGDETSLRKAVEDDPTRTDAVYALATLLLDTQRPEEAAALLAPFALDPTAEELLRAAAVGLDALAGSFEAAVASITPLLDRVRTDDEARATCVAILEGLPPADPRTVALRKTFASRLY